MSPQAPIRRMDDRMDAVFSSLTAALTTRHVSRSWLKRYDDHTPQELADGALMLISAGESGYSSSPGMVALNGTHRMILIGHLKVADASQPQDIEAAELDLIEEIRSWVRSGVPGVGVVLISAEHSRQLEHPYGWVVVYLDTGEPGANIN